MSQVRVLLHADESLCTANSASLMPGNKVSTNLETCPLVLESSFMNLKIKNKLPREVEMFISLFCWSSHWSFWTQVGILFRLEEQPLLDQPTWDYTFFTQGVKGHIFAQRWWKKLHYFHESSELAMPHKWSHDQCYQVVWLIMITWTDRSHDSDYVHQLYLSHQFPSRLVIVA